MYQNPREIEKGVRIKSNNPQQFTSLQGFMICTEHVTLHGVEVKGWGRHGDHRASVFTGDEEISSTACFFWGAED